MKHRRVIDIDLVNRCKNGDTEAFKDLVNAYKDVSLNLACSILKDAVLAEDTVQTAFIKMYQKIKTFKGTSHFSTWLYRIVLNTAYNDLKKLKNHENLDRMDTEFLEKEISVPADTLTNKDQKTFILKALNNLKSDEALVLRFFYLYEHSILEIEEITGFSKSKIKVDLYRGRQHLEQQLKKLLGDEITQLL